MGFLIHRSEGINQSEGKWRQTASQKESVADTRAWNLGSRMREVSLALHERSDHVYIQEA